MEVCIFGLGYISLSVARIALVGFPPHPIPPHPPPLKRK